MADVLVSVAASAVVAGVGVGIGAVSVNAALLSVATTALASGASYLQRSNTGGTSTAVRTSPIAAPANSERAIPIAQATPARRYVYGPTRTGGALFFEDNANPNLYVGCCLSDGVIENVDAVYFGEESIPVDGSGDAVAGSRFAGNFTLEWADGQASQLASAMLEAAFPDEIDSEFRQRGVARAVVRLGWGSDAAAHQALWGDSISPSYLIKGVKVYDPREVTHDINDATTWEYSANPALCIAHALMHAWGVSIAAEFLDWDSIEEAANDCDTTLTYNEQTVPIFRLGGVFQGDVEFGAQLGDMLTAFRGKITYSNGKYGLVADKARSSVWTITDADILELGEYQFATEGRQLFNAISAAYFNSNEDGSRATTTPYEMAAEITAEGLRETTVTLPFTPDAYSAQIIAYRELQHTRDGRALTLRTTDAGIYLTPGERVTIATTEATFLNGEFEVLQVDLADVGAFVTLRGYNPDVYTDPATYLI